MSATTPARAFKSDSYRIGRVSTGREASLCVWCRRRRVDPDWRPFCSERCKLQDLVRWADGAYAVPAEPVAGDDEDEGQESEV